MPKTIVFQLDNLKKLKPSTDTSLYLAQEYYRMGNSIFAYEPHNLCLRDRLYAGGNFLIPQNNSANSLSYGDFANFYLDEAECIFIRNDPPFNMDYLSPLFLLERVSELTFNRPHSIINNVEKLIPFHFPQFQVDTLVTSNPIEAQLFLDTHQDIVVKPLYGHGGRGVERINSQEQLNNLDFSKEPLLLQPFLSSIKNGDKRIFIVNGEVVTAFTKRSAPNNFITNTAAGGTVHKCDLTASDKNIVDTITPWLKHNGIFMAGLDVLDGILFEVNITSPTGLKIASQLYEKNLARICIDLLKN